MDNPSALTLRDWFAGMIAGGMAAHSGTCGAAFAPDDIAERSYEVADAMLAERAKSSDLDPIDTSVGGVE